jgi:acetyl-CoA decarbonylase/synthase complex subunit gamma
MRYQVKPGLYAVGEPTEASPVLVSANYKMSFDRLRSRLDGIDAWILVLDTKGINVWCAAGKGTFGTDEIVGRVEAVSLTAVVSHRTLIVPQLGAPGVAAHEVKKRAGFRVVYGPVRAEDLSEFLNVGMKATAPMRRVRFGLGDRLAVIPVELIQAVKPLALVAVCLVVLGGLGTDGYSLGRAFSAGLGSALLFVAVGVGTVVLAPALLPWLPGRAFALKGAWLGAAFLSAYLACVWLRPVLRDDWLGTAAWCLLIPAVASFLTMGFTGSTTYASLSGVRREMRIAVPIQAVAALIGFGLWLAGRFV